MNFAYVPGSKKKRVIKTTPAQEFEKQIEFQFNKLESMRAIRDAFKMNAPEEPKGRNGRNQYFFDTWIELQTSFYDKFSIVRDELETMNITKESMVYEMTRAIDNQSRDIIKMRIRNNGHLI